MDIMFLIGIVIAGVFFERRRRWHREFEERWRSVSAGISSSRTRRQSNGWPTSDRPTKPRRLMAQHAAAAGTGAGCAAACTVAGGCESDLEPDLTLPLFDGDAFGSSGPAGHDPFAVNPATGLPMVGGLGGLDVGGNVFGTDSGNCFDDGLSSAFDFSHQEDCFAAPHDDGLAATDWMQSPCSESGWDD